VLLAIHYSVRERVMVAGLLPLIPLAFVVARKSVARARQGDIPEWRPMFYRLGQRTAVPARQQRNFSSAGHAQVWFERQRHGRSLPVLVGILVPLELTLLFVVRDTPALVFEILFGALLTPVFMAALAAATVRKSNAYANDSYDVTPFMATRPLTTAVLFAAKLKATIWSTLSAWGIVLVELPVALKLSDTWPMVSGRAHLLALGIGTPRAVVILLLLIAGLIAATWKQLVQSLYIGLTGRAWMIKGSVFLILTFLFLLGPVLEWIIDNSDVQGALWDALPFILAILVGIKTVAAGWIATRLFRSHLLSDRALMTSAACWFIAVLALYGLFVWLLSTPFFPRSVLMLLAILAIPLVRLSAAPLALAWNRHR
jgi:hypothetical protein